MYSKAAGRLWQLSLHQGQPQELNHDQQSLSHLLLGGTLFSPNANLDGSSDEVRYSQQVLLTTRQGLVSLFVEP